jgi:hypothetical protein
MSHAALLSAAFWIGNFYEFVMSHAVLQLLLVLSAAFWFGNFYELVMSHTLMLPIAWYDLLIT